jgi:putative PIN family toxin of toxin-antitoxin system
MAKNKCRIILDTNWYISFLIKRGGSKLNNILTNINIDIVISEKLIAELRQKVTQPKFRVYFDEEIAVEFIESLIVRGTSVQSTSLIALCRDAKDNYLLALAKDAKADFLITGDKDLLVMTTFQNTIICTLSHFMDNYMSRK